MRDKIIKVLKSYIARSKDDSKDSYDEYISSFAEALDSLEAEEEIKDINFIMWYSGMEESKIRNAYKRYKK